MKLTFSFLIALALLAGGVARGSSSFAVPAQPERSPGTIEDERGLIALDQALREITNPFTVLSISARPGDEDDGALAYVRKKLGARAVLLFATRGEGSDSPTRAELDQELGAVRTHEAIEAARVIGSDAFFLNLRDIGYSKSADEVLSAWGHDEALRRMVRAIRLLRPDVIITNHDSKIGEGAEQAVARLAFEAFNAAGATKVTPDAGSEVWKVRRFFERTDDATAGLKIDLNEYDHIRGMTYARMGLSAHQRFLSRGAGLDQLTPERESSYYKLIASASDDQPKPDSKEMILRFPTVNTPAGVSAGLLNGLTLPENVSRSLAQPRVGGLGIVDAIATGERLVDALIEKLIEKRAEGTVDEMRARHGADFARVVRFTAALERAIALALGLYLEVAISDRTVVPGQKLAGRVVLRNGGVRAFPVVFITPERASDPVRGATNKESDVIGVGPGGVATQELEYEIAKDVALTLPHSAHLYDEDYYSVGSTLPGAQPAETFGNRLVVSADVGLGQVNIRLGALARFDVASPVEISTIPYALVRDWSKPRDINFAVRVRNRTPGKLAGALWVVPLALADDDYDPVHIAFAREDEEVTINLKLRLPILKPPLAPDVLIEFRREKPAPPDPLGTAKIAVKASDFEVADGLKTGYIRGLDEWLALALTELGIEHGELKIGDISVTEHGNANVAAQSRIGCGDLARFDTIIIDGDAYFTHSKLILQNRCLLRYVRQGGNLVVFGQEPSDWNLVLANTQLGPYPIKLSKDRITVESASVKITDREHPLVSRPNKITAKDFEGWVVDRAVNVPREWSSEYTALLESADPGEDPDRGCLLVARYGEGTYIYVSLSMRRQLVAGNAGAYRVFADLVSFPKVAKSPARPQ